MKNLLLLAFALFAASASAQATFNLSPDTVSVTVDLEAEEVGAYNNITNLTGSDIVIRWERTINIIDPDTLITRVCDPIQCYAEFVDTKTFTLTANATAPMSVHLYKAQGQNASAFVQLKYTDLAQPDAHQYSYYIFNSAPSGTNDVLPAASVKLYPNPVVESFSLDNADEVGRILVFSTDGRQVAVFNASAGQTYSLDGQAAGAYVVALESKSGKLFQAIGIRKN